MNPLNKISNKKHGETERANQTRACCCQQRVHVNTVLRCWYALVGVLPHTNSSAI